MTKWTWADLINLSMTGGSGDPSNKAFSKELCIF